MSSRLRFELIDDSSFRMVTSKGNVYDISTSSREADVGHMAIDVIRRVIEGEVDDHAKMLSILDILKANIINDSRMAGG